MKIGIDISQVVYGTGVSTYTRNLVENLLRIDQKNEYVLFGGSLRKLDELRKSVDNYRATVRGSSRGDREKNAGMRVRIYPLPPTAFDWLWNRWHLLPIELFTGKLDVFHTSDWTQPPAGAVKVSTVHDLTPILYPELVESRIAKVHKLAFKWLTKEVEFIIAPSEATKRDLLKLGVDRGRVVVISEAADKIFKPAAKSETEAVKRKFKLFSKYFLAVRVGPRKNTERIIKAYELTSFRKGTKLVIVGENVQNYEETRGVRFIGTVGIEDLVSLYSGAEMLIYPSLYEGFGLPILEAFACRCPVVTSNISSMPEVAGDAAVLVDPADVHDLASGIDEATKRRRELIKKGLKRVKEFSWEKTARKTLEVYQLAGKG